MNTNSVERKYIGTRWRYNFIYIFILGIVGVLSLLQFVIEIIPPEVLQKYSLSTIIILTLLQSVVFVGICAGIGTMLAKRIGFKTILDEVSYKKNNLWQILKDQFVYSIPIGILGALIAYLIAPDFVAYLNSVPQVSRIFGGIYEEIVIRWAIMTLIVWALWRIGQKGTGTPKKSLVWIGIILSQIIFACGHIFILIKSGITNPAWSVVTIFIVAFPWGWLFWKRGIESAIAAHVSFHIFVILLTAMKL